MDTKEKISECKTMIDAAFQGINKMTVTGVTGCTTVSAIADCLVKAYKLRCRHYRKAGAYFCEEHTE